MELELLATIQRKALGASAREEERREASVAVLLLYTTSRTTTTLSRLAIDILVLPLPRSLPRSLYDSHDG